MSWSLAAKAMHRLLPIVLLLMTAGCDSGIQKGRFAVERERSLSLASHTGCLCIISGHSLSQDDQIGGPLQDLIYLVIVCPGVYSQGSDSSSQHKDYHSTFTYTWKDKLGQVPVSICWNRRTDTITIGGQEFKRGNGNVFVVRHPRGGQETSQQ